MPKEVFGANHVFLPRAALLTDDELTRLAAAFARAGVTKLRITGGEPLLREDLPALLARLADIRGIDDLSLTTNGWRLPELARELAAAGLRRINVSLDALDDAIFGRMNGRDFKVARVLAGIDAALAAGLRVKINMVVQRGVNETEVRPMARHFRERGLTLRFIEYMDVGNSNGWRLEQVVPAQEIVRAIAAEHPLEPLGPNYRGEVAARYRYAGTDTEIGIISSVTEPFCRDCHRARLSADGKLFTCLFATAGTDLKTPLRRGLDDEQLYQLIARTWGARRDRYSEERAELVATEKPSAKVEMSYIGG
jgi:cyclic pyranopterin phosphate synthase